MNNSEQRNLFFRKLRKAGYFAKQNFHCCQTCATSAIPEEFATKYVYYHNQDYQRMRNGGDLMLGWAGDGTEIATLAQESGLQINWNGSPEQRMEIICQH